MKKVYIEIFGLNIGYAANCIRRKSSVALCFHYMVPIVVSLLYVGVLNAQTMYENFKPMEDARFFFSNKPFDKNNDGAVGKFTSAQYIFGRLELNGKTIKEVFKTASIQTAYPYLRFRVGSFKGDKQLGSCNFWTYLLLKQEELNQTWLNFDILPDPANATSAISGTEEFSSALAAGPMYHILNQGSFPGDDEYTIKVQLYLPARNAWGNLEDDEKWPVAEGSFKYQFAVNDVAKLQEAGKKADDRVSKNAFKLSKMPDWFYKTATVNDAKLSNANISAILKRDLPSKSMELIKFNVASYTGSLWLIEKNDLGLIMRRYVNPDINIAYRYSGQCYLGTARLWEEYKGGGQYGNLVVGSSTCNSCGQIIDCAAIK